MQRSALCVILQWQILVYKISIACDGEKDLLISDFIYFFVLSWQVSKNLTHNGAKFDSHVHSWIAFQANEMLHHKANLNGYLAYHTGQSLEKINQDTDRDFFMSAKEAKDYGLIDGVIMNPLKALQPLAASDQ